MQVKPPFSQNKPPTLHKKCSLNRCKMIPKWSQKRSRSGPRDTSKEKQQNFPKVDQKAPQNEPKKDIKITKNCLGGLLFHIKKTMIIWKLFFIVFCFPGRSQTLKIKPKRYKSRQKRGSHLFKKNSIF